MWKHYLTTSAHSTLLAALLFALAVTGAAQQPQDSVKFQTVQKYLFSRIFEDKNYVIANEEDWQALWDQLNPPDNKPPLPFIDFSQNMVIAVFRGNTSPLDVTITDVVREGKAMTVLATETTYNPNCVYPAVVYYPYHIIVTEKVSKKIRKRLTFEIARQVDSRCR